MTAVVRSIIPHSKQLSQCLRKHSLLLCLGQMIQVFRQRDPSRRQIAAFLNGLRSTKRQTRFYVRNIWPTGSKRV